MSTAKEGGRTGAETGGERHEVERRDARGEAGAGTGGLGTARSLGVAEKALPALSTTQQ